MLHIHGSSVKVAGIIDEIGKDVVDWKVGQRVAIVGTGGLVLTAVQLAEVVTRVNVIAMDLDDQKLDIAKKDGADFIINSKKEDPVKTTNCFL